MAKRLFIAAIDKNSGKTTTSISLMHLALKKYDRVGFFKPFGGQTVSYKGRVVDKDVALMAQVFGLGKYLHLMSPVVLSAGLTRDVVDGKTDPGALQSRILECYTEMERSFDYMIVEGSGHPGVGAILKLSNARIAHLLQAPVLLVTGGGLGNVVDRLDMIMALFQKEKVDVRAVLVNKLIAEKREKSIDYLRRALREEPFRVLGGFDYQPVLADPTLQRISSLLGAPVHGNRHELHRIIHRVLVGAASTQRIMELLSEPSLIIVTSSRNELLVTLAHLYHMPLYRRFIVGVVISGVAPISEVTQQILDKSKIPYLRAEKSVTAELYQTIRKDVSKITADDKEKLNLIRHLAEEIIDFDTIDDLFS